MLKMVAQRCLNNFCRFGRCQLVFGLALKFRLADKDRHQSGGRAHHIFAGDDVGFLIVDAVAIGFQPFGQRRAHALFVGAAFGGRHGVAIAGIHAVGITNTRCDPSDGPFNAAMPTFFLHFSGKWLRRHHGATADLLF